MQELTQAEDTDPNERLQAQIPDVSGTFTRVNNIGALIFRIGFGGISYSIIINKEPPKPYSNYYGPYIRGSEVYRGCRCYSYKALQGVVSVLGSYKFLPGFCKGLRGLGFQ